MNPKPICRDRGGNPFSINNALKPSKAQVTLHVVTVDGNSVDGRLSYLESEHLREQNAAYRRELAQVETLLRASAGRLAAMERRLGQILAGKADLARTVA